MVVVVFPDSSAKLTVDFTTFFDTVLYFLLTDRAQPGNLGSGPCSPLVCCVTLGDLLNLSEFSFLLCEMGITRVSST